MTLVLMFQGPVAAQEPCQRKQARDPRSARLQLVDLNLSQNAIIGKVKNNPSSGETALGVMVWVNYYISRRGGPVGQQCIVVGDLKPGEEREFQAPPIPEAEGAQAYDTAVDAVAWR